MRPADAPPQFDDWQNVIAARLADASGVLCCLDFDGTLAPIVDDPDDAVIDAACRTAIDSLTDRSSVEVAVISGRAIDDLHARVELDDVVYAGNHGLEFYHEERMEVHPEAAERRETLDDVCAAVEAGTSSIDGCIVEHKDVTATVHYRRVEDDQVRDVVNHVESVVTDADEEFAVHEGKQILDIRPRVDWDKGSVVKHLASAVPDDWITIYVGDDTTDEDAFRVVEPDGLGVLVGERAETNASVRIPDQSAVADFLRLIDPSLDEGDDGPASDEEGTGSLPDGVWDDGSVD